MIASYVNPDLEDGRRQHIEYRLPLVGKVCQEAFCLALSVSKFALQERIRDIKAANVFPSKHGLEERSGNHALDKSFVVQFFLAAASRFGERIPSSHVTSDWADMLLLPTAFTEQTIHRIGCCTT